MRRACMLNSTALSSQELRSFWVSVGDRELSRSPKLTKRIEALGTRMILPKTGLCLKETRLIKRLTFKKDFGVSLSFLLYTTECRVHVLYSSCDSDPSKLNDVLQNDFLTQERISFLLLCNYYTNVAFKR